MESVLDFDAAEMKQILITNVIGAALMFKAYYKLLKNSTASSKVINVGSQLGSLEMTMNRKWYDNNPFPLTTTSYRVSKAAKHMLTRCQAAQIGYNEDIIFLSVHPGHVDTDMGTSFGKRPASVDCKDASKGIIELIEKMDKTYNGTFYDWKHNKLPW